jgi:protein-disulfide isomerase
MMKKLLAATALAAVMTAPLAAFEINGMSDAERDAFRAEVRAYLLDNPEVLMEAIGVLEERQAAEAAAGDEELLAVNAEAIFNDGFSWVGGNPEGDITIVEFLDYRCGYCKKAHPEVTELLSSDGNIRYIVKELPILGDQSVLAARFAIAVLEVQGDAAYDDIHNELMTFRGEFTEESLSALSETKGYDTPSVLKAMNSPETKRIIDENRALAQRMNINGTPSFVFENQMVRGYVPLDGMIGIVAEVRG